MANKKIRTYDEYMKTYFPKKYADERLALRYLRDHGAVMDEILWAAKSIYETEIDKCASCGEEIERDDEYSYGMLYYCKECFQTNSILRL